MKVSAERLWLDAEDADLKVRLRGCFAIAIDILAPKQKLQFITYTTRGGFIEIELKLLCFNF